MDANKIIDQLGGTNSVAESCDVTKGAVSQWRKKGIPNARLMYLKLARPDVFGPAPACDCTQPQPMKEAA